MWGLCTCLVGDNLEVQPPVRKDYSISSGHLRYARGVCRHMQVLCHLNKELTFSKMWDSKEVLEWSLTIEEAMHGRCQKDSVPCFHGQLPCIQPLPLPTQRSLVFPTELELDKSLRCM